MRRLVDRSRTGGGETGRQNHRCWSTGEDRGNGGKLYLRIFASTVAMSLSRNVGRAISIAIIAMAGPGVRLNETSARSGTVTGAAAPRRDGAVPASAEGPV